MNDNTSFSDEMLNAYLDGELEADERAQVLQALRQDEDLSRRVCELQKIHNMVQLAYQNTALPEGYETANASSPGKRNFAIAASVFLVLGAFFSGWIAHNFNQAQTLIELAQEVRNNQPIAADDHWRLVLHLSTDDKYRMNVALNEIDRLLADSKRTQQKVNVEILANGKGMNMLRADTSAYAGRIKSLQEKYDNLLFQACGNTIARMKKEHGLDIQLLPNTQIVPSALGQRIKRQKEGWTYIHI